MKDWLILLFPVICCGGLVAAALMAMLAIPGSLIIAAISLGLLALYALVGIFFLFRSSYD